MGLFSRKKVAQVLDLTPARVSQMTTSGAIIPPIEDEDGTGWPASYVEEVAARRQGRQTSRSIYGYPPQATPYSWVSDAVVEVKDGGRKAFVQLLRVDGGLVGLITLLRETIVCEAPYLDGFDDRGLLYSTYGTDLLPFIHAAGKTLSVDEYDVAWVRLEEMQASEVVIITEPVHRDPSWSPISARREHEEDGKQAPIPWATLHAKLGAPVPMLEIPTAEVVDAWHRAGRTHTAVTVDIDGNYNRAMAASLLAQLASRAEAMWGSGWRANADALQLAFSRLDMNINWAASGTTYTSYLVDHEAEHLAPLTTVKYPEYAHLRSVLEPALLEELNAPRSVRQSAADALGRLVYRSYGPFGETPTPSLAYALERGIGAVVQKSLGEYSSATLDDNAERPVFYELRVFERRSWAASWNAYLDALSPARDRRSPDCRLLESKQHDLYSSERGASEPHILIDSDHNYVLTQEIIGYQDKNLTGVTVVVPLARLAEGRLDHLKTFDEIIVEPDTQDGPIMLSVDGQIHLMPFGAPYPDGFTHGYSGHGPSNLCKALKHFLEWAAGTEMTSAGADQLRGIVVGSDQDRPLRISRGQIFKQGSFEAVRE